MKILWKPSFWGHLRPEPFALVRLPLWLRKVDDQVFAGLIEVPILTASISRSCLP